MEHVTIWKLRAQNVWLLREKERLRETAPLLRPNCYLGQRREGAPNPNSPNHPGEGRKDPEESQGSDWEEVKQHVVERMEHSMRDEKALNKSTGGGEAAAKQTQPNKTTPHM